MGPRVRGDDILGLAVRARKSLVPTGDTHGKFPSDRYFGPMPFSFSASLRLSLKPPGITMSPGF